MADFECDTPFVCSNLTLTNVTEGDDVSTLGQGYKSIYGQGASLSNTICSAIGCHGSHSCQRMSFIDAGCGITGWGVQSLSYVNDVRATSISCSGVASCIGSTLITPWLSCGGGQSCTNTIIKATASINLYGAYSMLNSIIYSNNTDITLDMQGYNSGYNLTIICEKNDTCTLYCRGNACSKTFLKCHSDSVCIVYYCNGNTIDCPIQTTFNDTHPYSLGNNNDELDSSNFTMLYDFIELVNDINDDCDTNPNALVFDDYYGTGDMTNALGPICCRGRRSGWGIKYQNEASNGVILCSGMESCDNKQIEFSGINGTVYCLTKQSCYGAAIIFPNTTSGGVVYCSSDESCAGVEIYNATAVYCDGTRLHCADTKIVRTKKIYSIGSGYYPANYAQWVSGGVGNFTVYLGSLYAGRNLDIYCNATDNCTIICGMCDPFAFFVCLFIPISFYSFCCLV